MNVKCIIINNYTPTQVYEPYMCIYIKKLTLSSFFNFSLPSSLSADG